MLAIHSMKKMENVYDDNLYGTLFSHCRTYTKEVLYNSYDSWLCDCVCVPGVWVLDAYGNIVLFSICSTCKWFEMFIYVLHVYYSK